MHKVGSHRDPLILKADQYTLYMPAPKVEAEPFIYLDPYPILYAVTLGKLEDCANSTIACREYTWLKATLPALPMFNFEVIVGLVIIMHLI